MTSTPLEDLDPESLAAEVVDDSDLDATEGGS